MRSQGYRAGVANGAIMHPIVDFYEGHGRDSEGRTLEEILSWDDEMLEDVHSYIQWLFPLREASRFNPLAPLLDDAQTASFRTRPELRAALRRAFDRMLSFYGLEWEGETVRPGGSWEARAAEWVTPFNHNFLRLTRILTSLRLLGLESEARALYDALTDIAKKHRREVGNSAYYWRTAMDGAA